MHTSNSNCSKVGVGAQKWATSCSRRHLCEKYENFIVVLQFFAFNSIFDGLFSSCGNSFVVTSDGKFAGSWSLTTKLFDSSLLMFSSCLSFYVAILWRMRWKRRQAWKVIIVGMIEQKWRIVGINCGKWREFEFGTHPSQLAVLLVVGQRMMSTRVYLSYNTRKLFLFMFNFKDIMALI